MRYRPITPDALADLVAERIATRPGLVRVLLDGAPPAGTGDLADAVAARLRVLGRAPVRVRAADFLRPASLRFERGRTDPDVRYQDWLDLGGLRREVLDAAAHGRVLPALWDTGTDRAARAGYVTLPADGVVLLDGELLLGRGLPAELTVHLHLSAAALARRTPAAQQWALPAYARHERTADPVNRADVLVRVDNPAHPAVLAARGGAPAGR